ncbi:MAG: hypothetical protein E7590_08800 [Ruminococcaceae bacterium]|nr:hypothetical protein [Oscillospiraceae bacterium]
MKKRLIPIMALLLAAVLLLSGCASHGKTLLKAGDEEISVNVYQLYLSCMKGALAAAGYSVNDPNFWGTYVGAPEDNQTNNDFYSKQVFEGLRQIAAALILYEELGLKLDKSDKDAIDAWIDELIEEVGEGSKSKLNAVLSAYGANVTVLKDAAIIEAKLAQLKTHLYGENGSLIGETVKEQFYQRTYYRGRQMLIVAYYHDHEKDGDGNTRYYQTDDKGNLKSTYAYDTVNGTATEDTDKNGDTVYRKLGAIAYDTVKGKIAYDTVDGKQVKRRDAAGDAVYVLENGRIAYDTTKGRATEETDANGDTVYRKWVVAYDVKNGSPKYYYTKEGENKIVYYSTDEMEKRLLVAEKIAEDCKGNEALFLEYMKEFSDNLSFNDTYAPNGMYFSAGTYATDTVFHTFSTELAKLEIGDLAILQDSVAGYYVIMRTELDAGAWAKSENERWFGTLTGLVVEYMLQQRTADYLDRVQVDEALRGTVDITMVAANTLLLKKRFCA